MDVKKIVKLEPEQYMKLLNEEPVEVNGVPKTFEEGVLYDTGYLEFIEWYNKIMEAQYKQVAVNHTPMAMKSLEQEYEEIANDLSGQESTSTSAVGFTAILKNGDTIRITEPNGGNFYVNGKRLTNNYTFTGEGCEVVNVWVFDGRYGNQSSGRPTDNLIGPPILNDTPTFAITELVVRWLSQIPVIGDVYKNYATILETHKIDTIMGSHIKKFRFTGLKDLTVPALSNSIREFESDCTNFPKTDAFLNKSGLKKIVFPELKATAPVTLQSQKYGLAGCTNDDLSIEFPKLTSIGSNEHDKPSKNNTFFDGVKNIVLPQSVQYIGRYAFSNNQSVVLNCVNAHIDPNWCMTAIPALSLVSPWYPSINVAIATKGYNKDWFINCFTNILGYHEGEVDMGDGGMLLDFGEIVIPQESLDELRASEEGQAAIQAALDKNWSVEGA